MIIRPGSTLIVVLESNPAGESIDLRPSTVFAVFEKKIIISQTDPPISRYPRKKIITLSTLSRERSGPVRNAFSAKILEYFDEYRLATGAKVPALLITPTSTSRPFNLRAGYRISPPFNSGLELTLSWYPLNLLNISIGGLAFSHRYDFRFIIGMTIKLNLNIDGRDHGIEATIKRISYPGEQHQNQGLEFVSLEFSKLNAATRQSIGRKILDLQRDLRAKELNR